MATQKMKKKKLLIVSPILLLLLIFSLLAVSSSALPTKNLQDAAAKLFSAGYVSLSLTLEFGSESVIPPLNSLTILTPPDATFSASGQPSLSLLHFHFSPLHLSPHSLSALPPGTKIPTLFAKHSLTVTSSPSDSGRISLNGVKVNGSAIYDDGSLAIFGIDEFLDPNFDAAGPRTPSPNPGCSARAAAADDGVFHSFEVASEVLREKGYSVMASFLDLQLAEFKNETMLTVFAPPDEAMVGSIGNLTEFRSIFLRHIVPCLISWSDAVDLDNGVLLPTYLPGFMLSVTKSGQKLELNNVQVVPGEMFSNSWLVIHGLKGSFLAPDEKPSQPLPDVPSGVGRNSQKIAAMDSKVMKILIAFSFMFLSMVR